MESPHLLLISAGRIAASYRLPPCAARAIIIARAPPASRLGLIHFLTRETPMIEIRRVAMPQPAHSLRQWAGVGVLVLLAGLAGCDKFSGNDATHRINGPVHLAAGIAPGSIDTVNGAITIDDNAALTSATSVNGAIRVGAHATAESLQTVNGAIQLDAAVHVTGAVTTVNGALSLGDGADVGGALTNVNGKISLEGAHVGGGIKTVNAGIEISGNSRIEGGIHVQKPGIDFTSSPPKPQRIVIGPGATVQGEMRFDRPVELYVSDRATIGTVSGATAVRFAGDKPPS
jgi:cytoskeletal protein CcmA (bactofilin family)